MQEFEILIVGDGCADDSSAVVNGFRDPRIPWHDLGRNHGSQWAANNHGIENAAADWIAYLGHDDIWYPTHLEAVLRAAREQSADVVTSVMIVSGPPGIGIRSVAGVFGGATLSRQDIVPPSALAHSRALVRRLRWPAAPTTVLPVDAVFFRDLVAASAREASTNEVTCFKFPAAWRRNAYKVRPVAEQKALLKWIEAGGNFRQTELLKVVRAVVADKFLRIRIPETDGLSPGGFWNSWSRAKGTAPRYASSQLQRIKRPTRFDLAGQEMPFEWHELEHNPTHGSYRSTGPSPRSIIDLPVVFDRDLAIRIHVIGTLTEQAVTAVRLSACGRQLECLVERQAGGTFLIHAVARRPLQLDPEGEIEVTVEVDPLTRPSDISTSPDVRWLGLAVNWIELAPLPVMRQPR